MRYLVLITLFSLLTSLKVLGQGPTASENDLYYFEVENKLFSVGDLTSSTNYSPSTTKSIIGLSLMVVGSTFLIVGLKRGIENAGCVTTSVLSAFALQNHTCETKNANAFLISGTLLWVSGIIIYPFKNPWGKNWTGSGTTKSKPIYVGINQNGVGLCYYF